MELNKVEVAVIESAIAEALPSSEQELSLLQLAMVGGGIGETTL